MLEEAQSKRETEEVFKFFTRFVKTLLKTNKNKSKSIPTGISKLSTSGIFSNWNNIHEYHLIKGK